MKPKSVLRYYLNKNYKYNLKKDVLNSNYHLHFSVYKLKTLSSFMKFLISFVKTVVTFDDFKDTIQIPPQIFNCFLTTSIGSNCHLK